MRIYCVAQETLLGALWWPKWEGNPERGLFVHIVDDWLCYTAVSSNYISDKGKSVCVRSTKYSA